MRRYLHVYKWKHTDFANFSINAHANAMHNPNARLHEIISLEAYNTARMVAEPINLLDASPTGDGAAAVVIVPIEFYKYSDKPLITIAGSASATDTLAVHSRSDPLWLSAAEKSAKKLTHKLGLLPRTSKFLSSMMHSRLCPPFPSRHVASQTEARVLDWLWITRFNRRERSP